MKQLLILSIIIFLGACAPKFSKQDISQARYAMNASQGKVNSIKQKLGSNNAYRNGACITPARYKKPTPYVTSERQAKDYSHAYCLSPLACELSTSALNLDSAAERFLGSELCGRYTDELRADGQITNNTAINIFESVADSGCDQETEGIFMWLVKATSCVMSASAKLTKLAQLENCLNNKHKQYLKASQGWYNYPAKERLACESLGSQLASAQQDLKSKRSTYKYMVNY